MSEPTTSLTINAAIAGEGAIDSKFVDALEVAFGVRGTEVRTVLRSALRATGTAAEGFEIRTGAWRLDLNRDHQGRSVRHRHDADSAWPEY